MKSFHTQLSLYRKSGAGALEAEVNDLINLAVNDSSASKGFCYFVSDVCMDLKMFKSAVEVLLKLEEKRRLGDIGYNNIGYCYWELGDFESAYSFFEKSLFLNPKNVSSARGATFCGICTDRVFDAIKWGKIFYELSGNSKEAAVWLATAFYNARNDKCLAKLIEGRVEIFGEEVELKDFKTIPVELERQKGSGGSDQSK